MPHVVGSNRMGHIKVISDVGEEVKIVFGVIQKDGFLTVKKEYLPKGKAKTI